MAFLIFSPVLSSFLGDWDRLRRIRSFNTKSAPRISRKPSALAALESRNFTRTSIPTLSIATPDMTSLTFGRQLFFIENGENQV